MSRRPDVHLVHGTPLGGAVFGSLPAGPLFVASLSAVWLYAEMPKAIPVDPAILPMFVGMLLVSIIPGMALAILPNLLGSAVMGMLGEISETAREPFAWIAAGFAMGAGLAAWLLGFEQNAPAAAALAMTSAGCAYLSRTKVRWTVQA